ncbi:tRNA preQ1(34) S-adenosylmethionine ribosyltransferase-isomerase QueA [Bauldia sp.]|uniref:tRNA preQ1(34) S-adenosylmethionine ribosyltransferase-isomerase QueA n=1 Tax=Bauldia sp. TaxID=2575872 RepID=UPI003BAA696B
MRVDLFDFDLPEENIALRPVTPRDAARLLCVTPPDSFADHRVSDLPELLREGDVLVVNDTKVIPAELRGQRHRGDHVTDVSVTLYERLDEQQWKAFARPARRLAGGDRLHLGDGLEAEVKSRDEGGSVSLRFALAGPALDEAIRRHGHIPLPPYIAGRRPEDAQDRRDYQTIYAREEGAVAAPTAGLHFTDTLLQRLADAGVNLCRVTLHVGPGTFLPVKADDTEGHAMHAEWGTIGADVVETLNRARAAGGRIIAVGTTSLRLLETAASDDGLIQPFGDETALFITPGYRFKAVDLLMTNFHLPRSTLFMLVSAFSGRETMLNAYRHAIAAGYRFYSYGDACLLHPESRT